MGDEFEVLVNGVALPLRSRRLSEALTRVRSVIEAGLTATVRPVAVVEAHSDADLHESTESEGRPRRDTLWPSFAANTDQAGDSLGPISLRHSLPPARLQPRGDTTGVFPVLKSEGPQRKRKVTRDWRVA